MIFHNDLDFWQLMRNRVFLQAFSNVAVDGFCFLHTVLFLLSLFICRELPFSPEGEVAVQAPGCGIALVH